MIQNIIVWIGSFFIIFGFVIFASLKVVGDVNKSIEGIFSVLGAVTPDHIPVADTISAVVIIQGLIDQLEIYQKEENRNALRQKMLSIHRDADLIRDRRI